MWLFKSSHLLWFLVFSQLLANSLGFFFPLFGNFLNNRFRNNHNGNQFVGGGQGGSEGGVSIFSKRAGGNTATGNVTSISVPMLRSLIKRRLDVLTTVISPTQGNSTSSSSSSVSIVSPHEIEVHSNVTRLGLSSNSSSDQQVLSTSHKLIIPTSTSVTSTISASHQGVPVILNQIQTFGTPNTLTLPFTPNLFGMMSYVQAFKDIKRNYKDQEKERKIMFHNREGGDLMTRILRTLIQKVVHKHQKHTEILKLKILKRQDKLQKFLQLPMVSQVIAIDQARAANEGVGVAKPTNFGNVGAGFLVPQLATGASQATPFSRSGNPIHSILSSFLI